MPSYKLIAVVELNLLDIEYQTFYLDEKPSLVLVLCTQLLHTIFTSCWWSSANAAPWRLALLY